MIKLTLDLFQSTFPHMHCELGQRFNCNKARRIDKVRVKKLFLRCTAIESTPYEKYLKSRSEYEYTAQ